MSNLCEAVRDNSAFYEAVLSLAKAQGLSWIYLRKTASLNPGYDGDPAAKKAKMEMPGGGGTLATSVGHGQHQHPYAPPPPGGINMPKRPHIDVVINSANIGMGGGGGGGGYANFGAPAPGPPPGPPMFTDLNDVARCRLSEEERRKDPAFNFYQPGEPSKRLYVKNISRLTQESDLRSLFALFAEDGMHKFSLKYFTVGKMRYQCFVEYDTMEAAFSALVHTNGVMVHDKPICVSFGKSR